MTSKCTEESKPWLWYLRQRHSLPYKHLCVKSASAPETVSHHKKKKPQRNKSFQKPTENKSSLKRKQAWHCQSPFPSNRDRNGGNWQKEGRWPGIVPDLLNHAAVFVELVHTMPLNQQIRSLDLGQWQRQHLIKPLHEWERMKENYSRTKLAMAL